MSDVGFDSQKHEQTRQDVQQGGAGLESASTALQSLADAQSEDVWGNEAGVAAAREQLISFLTVAREGLTDEKDGYEDFGSKVNRAEEDFTRTEEAAAGQLASAGTAMNSNAAIANAAAGAGSAASASTAPSGVPSAVGDQPEI